MQRPGGNWQSCGMPMRIIREVRMMARGAGHVRVFKLACGHTVERMGARDRHVNDRLACPHCK